MKRIEYVVGLAFIGLVAALAGCGADGEGSPENGDGPTAGEAPAEEIELVIYHSFEPDRFDPVVEPFVDYYKEQTGNDVTISTVVQEEAAIDLEAQSGGIRGDLVVLGLGGLLGLQEKHDAFRRVTLEDDSDEGIPDSYREIADRHGFVPLWSAPVWLAYNTQKVAPDEVPSSYEDLLDERWRGRFGMADPETSNVGHSSLWLLAEHLEQTVGEPYGWEFFERLGALDPTLGAGAGPVLEMLASGELEVALAGAGAVINSANDGNPIAAVVPSEGISAHLSAIGVVEGRDHADAAEMFAQWTTTSEFQERARDNLNYVSIRSDVGLMEVPFDIEFTLDQVLAVDDQWVADERDENIARFAELMRP